MMQDKVKELVDKALEERPSLFLIDLNISPANQIIVVLDGDNGVSMQDCVEVSRAVESELDRDTYDYSIEVTTAGATSPITMPRQYPKNIGRKLKVQTVDGQKIEARLESVDDEGITLKWKAREPKPIGKGKHTVQKEAVIKYSNIKEAKAVITFN
ncbi:MAG TPA: ribosome assembly cofactor RimP [Flavobacteriaceae bacterium]|nr:ribosome assembly cofactor RimP [Flavobacteriaceae bacterium]